MATRGPLRSTFRSLSSRNLRLFFAGQTVSVCGTWLQKAAQAWLVLELTDSGTLLGVAAALQQLPTLVLGLWGGLLADRMDKRRLLLLCQSASAVPALLLGILTATGTIQLWIVLVLATLLGLIDALDKPARHTFIIEIVDDQDSLTNAVALNGTVQNFGKVVGPAIAGVLIVEAGLATTFFVNAASFAAVIVGLILILIRPDIALRPQPQPRERGQILGALRYVRGTPALLGPLVVMIVSGMLAYGWQVTLPVFARDTFDGDAQVFGLMFSAMGLGAVVGGLALAGLLHASIRSLVGAGLAFSILMFLLAATPWLVVALSLLFLLGAASVAFRTVASSHVQLTADPEMRGRVMALLLVAMMGMTPIGGPLVGWISEVLDARVAFLVGGFGTAGAVLAMVAYLRRAGRVGASPDGPTGCGDAGVQARG